MDCSIIKVSFDEGERSEWIFRGSNRIEVVKKYLDKLLQQKPIQGHTASVACSKAGDDPTKRIISISDSSDDEGRASQDENDAASASRKDSQKSKTGSDETDAVASGPKLTVRLDRTDLQSKSAARELSS